MSRSRAKFVALSLASAKRALAAKQEPRPKEPKGGVSRALVIWNDYEGSGLRNARGS